MCGNVCDCVRACVCVLSPSVRPWLGRRREGDFKTERGKEQRQLGMSEPLSCEERGGFCAVRTLSERCQNAVRTLSEQCSATQCSLTSLGSGSLRGRHNHPPHSRGHGVRSCPFTPCLIALCECTHNHTVSHRKSRSRNTKRPNPQMNNSAPQTLVE